MDCYYDDYFELYVVSFLEYIDNQFKVDEFVYNNPRYDMYSTDYDFNFTTTDKAEYYIITDNIAKLDYMRECWG